MSGIQDNIKNGRLSGGTLSPGAELALETKAFYSEQAELATNVFYGSAQGLNSLDFFVWTDVKLRAAAVINPSTGEQLSDSWQRIWIFKPLVEKIPRGAKIAFDDSVWLVVNPENVASLIGTAVVRKCDTVWRSLDWYGRVTEEPMAFFDGAVLASTNDFNQYGVLMNAYQHSYMQKNPETVGAHNNSRVILGSSAWYMRGLVDFIRSSTKDDESARLLRFDLTVTEPVDSDDMKNSIAGGAAFSWEILLSGSKTMGIGSAQTLNAASRRNGENVAADAEHPINYIWLSSDNAVAKVSPKGVVTAVSGGKAVITCALAQNPELAGRFELNITTEGGSGLRWTDPIPSGLSQYSETLISAAFFENGVRVGDIVEFEASGAPLSAYSMTAGNNGAIIHCYAPSSIPLRLTAICRGERLTASMFLESY
ncbi:MAG: hypothetical protein RR235_04995 [Oscillospiraceae bacterium]